MTSCDPSWWLHPALSFATGATGGAVALALVHLGRTDDRFRVPAVTWAGAMAMLTWVLAERFALYSMTSALVFVFPIGGAMLRRPGDAARRIALALASVPLAYFLTTAIADMLARGDCSTGFP